MRRRLPAALALSCIAVLTAGAAPAQEAVLPSATDPAIADADWPNLVYGGGSAGAPLVVFLAGTGGTSANAPRLLLETVAKQGYRVVELSYNDTPAVSQICPARPPACSARFRQARVFGGVGNGPVGNPSAEAIVPRLVSLLRYLDRVHPGDGWDGYLDGKGAPDWSRIVVSGLSQGAGMAAFIAKRFPVNRVVLFSSPWDVTGPDRRPAPWLSQPSATPMNRWWAERHRREKTTELIGNAYAALRIPDAHILIFDGTPPASVRSRDPYHTTTVRLPRYVPQWRTMFGTP